MRKIEDDLRTIGISEEIINHAALKEILRDYTYYNINEQERFHFEVTKDEIKISRLGESELLIRNMGTDLQIIGLGVVKTIALGKNSEELEERTDSYKKDSMVYYSTESTYLKNGLEQTRVKTIKHQYQALGHDIIVERIEREPNGYIAKVMSREFPDDSKANTSDMTEIVGYVDLDLRRSKLYQGASRGFSIFELGDNIAVGSIPHKITPEEFETFETHLNEEQKKYIEKGIANDSDEEQKKWIEEYSKGLAVVQEMKEREGRSK